MGPAAGALHRFPWLRSSEQSGKVDSVEEFEAVDLLLSRQTVCVLTDRKVQTVVLGLGDQSAVPCDRSAWEGGEA